jgi:hypothetical protein
VIYICSCPRCVIWSWTDQLLNIVRGLLAAAALKRCCEICDLLVVCYGAILVEVFPPVWMNANIPPIRGWDHVNVDGRVAIRIMPPNSREVVHVVLVPSRQMEGKVIRGCHRRIDEI